MTLYHTLKTKTKGYLRQSYGLLYNLTHAFQIDIGSKPKHRFPYFHHAKNCGYPPHRKTERTIELALANFWLNQVDEVWEVGAVTPYYWPGRIPYIVDPADQHPDVSHPVSLFELDFTGKNVLCISTIEHIGEDRYGLNEDASPIAALKKLLAESKNLLLTFPLGWREPLDEYILDYGHQLKGQVRFLVRNEDETWQPVAATEAWRPYGGNGITWANSLAIIEKGHVL